MWAAWAGLPEAPEGAFDSVRLAVSGAARLPDEVARTMDRRYGVHLTEAAAHDLWAGPLTPVVRALAPTAPP